MWRGGKPPRAHGAGQGRAGSQPRPSSDYWGNSQLPGFCPPSLLWLGLHMGPARAGFRNCRALAPGVTTQLPACRPAPASPHFPGLQPLGHLGRDPISRGRSGWWRPRRLCDLGHITGVLLGRATVRWQCGGPSQGKDHSDTSSSPVKAWASCLRKGGLRQRWGRGPCAEATLGSGQKWT